MRESERTLEHAPIRVEMKNTGCDLELCVGEFFMWAKAQFWYRPGLLYSGFVEDPSSALLVVVKVKFVFS
jgi:hypothetical protein